MHLCVRNGCFAFAKPGDRFCIPCRLERDRHFADGPTQHRPVGVDPDASRLSRALQHEQLLMERAEYAS